jgi:hypothetical protein
MRVSRDTKARVVSIKADAQEARAQLERCLLRLNEHAGTKHVAKKLERIVEQLDRWQQVA